MTPGGVAGVSGQAQAREDRSLPMPELPLLEDPLGSLEFRLRSTGPAAADPPFSIAGRRALAAGGAARGIDEVWAHPIRLAARLGVTGSAGESLTITPLGLERRIVAAGCALLERVVVPQEAPACIVEWVPVRDAAEVDVGWLCDLRRSGSPGETPGVPLRWRRAGRGLVVAGEGETRAVFAFSALPESLEVEDASEGGRPLVRVRARARVTRRAPLRLGIAGGDGDAPLRRALAAADRTVALGRARRASAERLMTDRLSLACPAPPVVQSLEWDKHRLETSLAEAPGLGRSLLAGYRSSADAPFEADSRAGPRFAGAASARDALTACAAGSTRLARDVLLFLGRHLDASGRALGDCSTGGAPRHDDPEATPLYLLLAARYAAWTGDLGTLRAEWPRLLRARHAAIRDDPGAAASSLLGCALAELAPAAEAIGEGEASSELRREAGLRGGLPWGLERGLETSIGRLVHGMLGAEPDATRGRLVLRPDPPPAWRAFTVGGLVVGSAAVSLRYRREGGRHAFRLAQERGAVPLRVILEPRLPGGRLRRAAVDGVEAELDARPEGDKLVVPVQVVLDHGREVVLEPDGSAEMERRRD